MSSSSLRGARLGRLLLALLVGGCRERGRASPAEGAAPVDLARPPPPSVAPRALDDASLGASLDASTRGAGSADVRGWPFVEHARRWCLPDQLSNTEYLSKWVPLWHGRLGAGEPEPRIDRWLPRVDGRNPTVAEDAQRLLAWQSAPRVSHVMDCALPVIERGSDVERTTSYAIYLPADYLDHPERPRPVLVLVSGGNGNRTRWFLTPTRRRGVIPGTGGMEVRRRVDAWASAHPDRAPPIVVGLDGSSDQFPNGMHEYIGRELQEHILRVYLPTLERRSIAIGVESISSGAVEVARAMHERSDAFDSVGFLCPFVDPSALNVESTFGTLAQRTEVFRALAARHRAGVFAMRFSIGDQDSHYPSTWEFYRLLAQAGLFPTPGAPTLEQCDPPDRPPSRGRCATVWSGFYRYPNEFHNYHALLPSWPSQFEWDLNTLSDILLRKQSDGGATTLDGGVSDATR